MWYNHKFFKYAFGILLVLTIIYLADKVDFFLVPFRKLVATLFFPLLISGLLYYLLRPLVRFAESRKVPRVAAIFMVFFIVLAVLSAFSAYAGSVIVEQSKQLFQDLPAIVQSVTIKTNEIIESETFGFLPIGELQKQATSFLTRIVPTLSRSVFEIVSTLTGVVTILVIVPFILFYMLRDDNRLLPAILKFLPEKHRQNAGKILAEVDKTLSSYIVSQAILALSLGVMMYVGYLLLGVKYSLILAIFGMITSVIPFFGAIIGVLPALLVGFTQNLYLPIKILVMVIIIQQLQDNLIAPYILGRRLDIHPLTLILLIMIAASFYGFVGVIVAIPAYAALKTIFINVNRIYKLWRS